MIPSNFIASETISFTLTHETYNPGNGFALTFYLAGSERKSKAATTENPTTFRVTLTAVETGIAPGLYWYQAKVTKAAENYVIESGQLEIKPDLSAGSGAFDGRSQYQKILDLIDDAIARQELSYTIGSRQITFKSNEELLRARDKYALLASQLKHRDHLINGGSFFQPVKVKFTR